MVRHSSLLILAQRLWKDLTSAILNKDMEAATDAKTAVEDAQREQRKTMEESGETHVPRFFELRDGRWEPRFTYVAPYQ
jgi:oxysterol-binding protein-related protein 8